MYKPPNIFNTIESTAMALLLYSMLSLSFALLIVRIFSKTNLILILVRSWRSFTDFFHLYQLYKVSQFADDNEFQENRLYRQVSAYLASLSSAEDSDQVDLVSGQTSGEVFFRIAAGDSVRDEFLGARVHWTSVDKAFVLKIRRNDRRRVFRQYLQRIQTVGDSEIRLHVVSGGERRRWIPVPFSNPASFETIVVEPEIKSRVVSDLELFLKSKQYYHRIGRVWRRSYLLSGASGTGKTSFAAAMAKFLRYDVFDLEVTADRSVLKGLVLQTTPRSVIVVEGLGRLICAGSSSPASLVSFMDEIISCCGEERIVVFTMNSQDKERLDRTAIRPGLIDVNVHLPLCDNFSAFKNLASTYLGVNEHKLFSQVEEIFQTGGPGFLSPAHIGEIMLSNRGSPSRALKSVISALQTGSVRLSNSNSGRSVDESTGSVFSREGIPTVKEFRKLYGLLKMGSRRKEEPILYSGSGHKEGLRHVS